MGGDVVLAKERTLMAVQPTRLSEQHSETSSIVRMTFMTSNVQPHWCRASGPKNANRTVPRHPVKADG
jgi:hypothetical protein